MQVKKFDDYSKLNNEMSKYRIYCKCGHSVLIYPFEKRDKKLCSYCGNLVYKNDLTKFKCLLSKKMKEVEL
jgi:hypothetical protein